MPGCMVSAICYTIIQANRICSPALCWHGCITAERRYTYAIKKRVTDMAVTASAYSAYAGAMARILSAVSPYAEVQVGRQAESRREGEQEAGKCR